MLICLQKIMAKKHTFSKCKTNGKNGLTKQQGTKTK